MKKSMHIDFWLRWCKVLGGNCKNMKTKSKYIFFSLFASLILLALHSMYIIGIAYTQNKPENLSWSLPLLIISISVIFCVFVFKPAINKTWASLATKEDECKLMESGDKAMLYEERLAKKSEFKWSTLMGPSTREQVQKVIERKRKGWRLPTESELTGFDIKCPYFHHRHVLSYWLQGEASLIVRGGSWVHENVPADTKANYCLVREV
jgi:hypothetical protein